AWRKAGREAGEEIAVLARIVYEPQVTKVWVTQLPDGARVTLASCSLGPVAPRGGRSASPFADTRTLPVQPRNNPLPGGGDGDTSGLRQAPELTDDPVFANENGWVHTWLPLPGARLWPSP